jgi:thiol-disulfide isomerase/thioredoxin
MRILVTFALLVSLLSCSKKPELKPGTWRGILEIQGQELPFNLELNKTESGYTAFLKNAGEKLLLDEIYVTSDSVRIVLHVFDAELRAAIQDNKLSGFFIKNFETNYRIPFHATWGDDFRFEKSTHQSDVDFSGKYDVTFFGKTDSTKAVGIFNQVESHVDGTFLLPDGDYRYLEGSVMDNKMWLSTFDGHHAYLFSASKNGDLTGDFWSGKAFHATWVAHRNDSARLPDLNKLAFLKKGYHNLDFHFPNLDSVNVSPSDKRFANKVVILQILGTWCPNCMDETKFLSRWYDKNKDRGVEILGLAFERKPDFRYAADRVGKMKQKWGVNYEIVIAGTHDKASASLPALDGLLAFPTTIFIGRDGTVKRIHTGFTGPGTGAYYEQFIQEFNEEVNELLDEPLNSGLQASK